METTEQLEKQERRSLKARLTLIDTNMKACRGMTNNSDTWKRAKFRCHVQNMIENGQELLALTEPEQPEQLATADEPFIPGLNGAAHEQQPVG